MAEIARLREANAPAQAIAERLAALRVLAPRVLGRGGYGAALARLRPQTKNPRQWARRIVSRAKQSAPLRCPATVVVNDETLDLYGRLVRIAQRPECAQRARLDALSCETGLSVKALRRKMHIAVSEGPAALNRKPRRDAGRTALPEGVQQAFIQRRLDRSSKHETIASSIARVREQFPGLACGDYPFRRLARSLPRAVTMKDKEWRARFLPVGNWEVPHPNHTWAFDFTTADVFVWDGDPGERPYRPSLTAIVDECTQSCMFALYSREAPNRETLQAVLLHAMLPKPDKLWIQHGVPLHLHADNGMVQGSLWLEQVCETMSCDLAMMQDLRHTQVRSPWQQGHVESFFGILHSQFETQLAGYCGNRPDNKPESLDLGGGPRAWRDLLNLEQLNHALHIWIPADYHRQRHRRLKMSRLEYWQIHAPGHIRLPVNAEVYLRHTLMRREARRVRRARVSVNGYFYWSERLMAYEGCDLEVRWDPGDLHRVLVVSTAGDGIWVEREMTGRLDHPADLAEHKRLKRAIKRERQVLLDSARYLPTAAPESRRAYERALREARDAAPIPFPCAAREQKAPGTEERVTIEEACTYGISKDDAELMAGEDRLIDVQELMLKLRSRAVRTEEPEEDPFELHGIPI
jgi:hypothetical protein